MEIFVLGVTVGSILGYTIRSLTSRRRRRRFYS
jgi:hypothetical protein